MNMCISSYRTNSPRRSIILRVKTDVVRLKPQTCLVQIKGRTAHEASTGSVFKQRRLVVDGVVATSDAPHREMSTVVELKRAPRISVGLGVTAVSLQGAA